MFYNQFSNLIREAWLYPCLSYGDIHWHLRQHFKVSHHDIRLSFYENTQYSKGCIQNKIWTGYCCILRFQPKSQRNLLLLYIIATDKQNDCLCRIKLVLRLRGNCKWIISIFLRLKIFAFDA